MSLLRSIPAILFLVPFLNSCGNGKEDVSLDSVLNDTATKQVEVPALPQSQNIEAKTYEVKDASGKSSGWGYDLYVEGKRTIHQEIFPGLPGNNSFQSEEDARRMGQLAADRMKLTGTFPTIVPNDFDSLGTKLPKELQKMIDSILTKEKNPHGK